MSRRRTSLVFALALGGFVALAAHAAPALARHHHRHRSRPSRRGSRDPDAQIARRHIAAARKLERRHQYARAIAEYQAAQRVKPSPDIDRRIGLCYDLMERWSDAVAAYQRSLDAAPRGHEAARVRARLAVLRKRLARTPSGQAASATPPAGSAGSVRAAGAAAPAANAPAAGSVAAPSPGSIATTPPGPLAAPSQPRRSHRARRAIALEAAGFSLLAAGLGLGVGGGVGFAVAGIHDGQALADLADQGKPFDPALYDAGSRDQTLSIALGVCGGVLGAAGLSMAIVGLRARPSSRADAGLAAIHLVPAGGPGYAGATLVGSFP